MHEDVCETLSVDRDTVAFEDLPEVSARVKSMPERVSDHVVRSRQRSSVELPIATTADGAGKNTRAAERHEPPKIASRDGPSREGVFL